jgi:uncharacterized protein (DUF924 family)
MKSEEYDEEIKEKFGDLLKEAEQGKGFGWLHTKDSYVAYIILLDQFSRHIYRGSGDSYKNDTGVMIFTELGFDLYREQLNGYEFMFAFMPYMHIENIEYQTKGGKHFELHKRLYTSHGHPHYLGRNNSSNWMRPLSDENHPSYSARMGCIPEKTNYDKEYEMLKSMESHVQGHRQVIQMFGRFPKRNAALGRDNTFQEEQYINRADIQKRPY